MDINEIKITEQEILEDERIDAYLRGKLSAEEEQQFLSEVNANPELKEKALAHARMMKSIEDVGKQHEAEIASDFQGVNKEDVKEMIASITSSGQVKSKSRTIPLLRIISIAAVFLALFVFSGIKYVDYHNTVALGEEYAVYITDMHDQANIRGNEDAEVTKELAALFDKVKTDEVDDATISRLEALWQESTSDNYNDFTIYSSEIGYALAIAYLRSGDRDKGIRILEKLLEIKHTGSNDKRIQELLKKTM